MKTKRYFHPTRGSTLTEVMIVVVVVFVLAAVILPALRNAQRKPKRINCVNHLKQISLGIKIFANDNNDEFPWALSTNKGGSREWVGSQEIFRHFQVVSNAIQSPKVFVCPMDTRSTPAKSFDALANTNLSYFVNLANTNDANPSDLLVGDRGLTIKGLELTTGNYWIPTQMELQWGPPSHNGYGNIGLSDGSVQQVNSANLQKAILNASLATNYLAIP